MAAKDFNSYPTSSTDKVEIFYYVFDWEDGAKVTSDILDVEKAKPTRVFVTKNKKTAFCVAQGEASKRVQYEQNEKENW